MNTLLDIMSGPNNSFSFQKGMPPILSNGMVPGCQMEVICDEGSEYGFLRPCYQDEGHLLRDGFRPPKQDS